MLSDADKELRRLGIGSSESAAIAGLPSFVKPIEVWRSKLEPGYEAEQTFIMRMGELLEDDNITLLEEREGITVAKVGTWKHPTLPIVDTPDGIATLKDGRSTAPVEAKLVLPWQAQEFGEEFTDQVPKPYYAQAQHHLWARRQRGFEDAFCFMPVFVGLTEHRLYIIPWVPELAADLIQRDLAFWHAHVVTGVPPEPDGTLEYTHYLAQKYPQTQRVVLSANDDAEREAQVYLKEKAASEAATLRMTEAANRLRDIVKEAEGVAGKGWAASWKADKNGKRSFRLKEGAA